jgi:adenosylcobinamide-GDP ribazoletransferase
MSRRAELAAAFGLLTRLPFGWLDKTDTTAAAARSVWAYPIAGIVVGAIGGLVYWLADVIGLPTTVASVFAVSAMVLATGAMHEDGAADTADGLGGGADRARKLEIMRDSRIGAYGVIALVLILALRISLIAGLAVPTIAIAALIASAALSRSTMVLLMFLMPRARTDGLSVHVGRPTGTATLEAQAIAILVVFLFLPFGTAFLAILAAAIGAAIMGLLARKQIGGQTGDILGAAGIAAECAALAAIAAIISPG